MSALKKACSGADHREHLSKSAAGHEHKAAVQWRCGGIFTYVNRTENTQDVCSGFSNKAIV